MYIPGAFVEIMVVGLVSLLSILPWLAIITPLNQLTKLHNLNSVGVTTFIAIAYITGIVVDRSSDNFLSHFRRKLRKKAIHKHNTKTQKNINDNFDFHQAVMLIFQTSDAIRDQIMYLRHKIRILRSFIFVVPVLSLGFIMALFLGDYYQYFSILQIPILIIILLAIGSLGTIYIYNLWKDMLLDYYRHLIDGCEICERIQNKKQ